MNSASIRRSLVFYFSSEIFLSLGVGFVTYAQPFFYRQGGLSDSTIGLLFAVNALAGGVAALLFGSAADRVGASRVFKFSTLTIALSYLLLSVTHSLGAWVTASGLSGLAGAMLMSTENVVLSSLTKGREMASVLSKFVALYTFIIGIGVVTSGILSSSIGYSATIRIGALIALVSPVIRIFVTAPDAKSERLIRIPSGRIWAMSLFAMLFGLSLSFFNPFATLVLHGTFGLSDSSTALISSISLFMMSFGSFLVSALVRRFRQQRTLFFTFVASAVMTLVMILPGNAGGFTAFYLGRTVLTSVPGSIVDAMFLQLTHETEYVQMFGVRVFGTNVGNAAGSYSGGLFLSHSGVAWMLGLSALGLVLTYIYLLWLIKRLHSVRVNVRMDGEETGLEG